MSLGVLNNISAIYAQNNLDQSQASLQKVLTQLSSGSRINSGADDAAGLSLANGLQASSTALSQSATNASEGVDFLQVADGALSQVTSLLNRAVTLATEASNGTLDSSQQAATQSEYSSIMSEIDTISGNTEYNGINVFQNAANIFTSDGSVQQSYATKALGATNSQAIGLSGLTLYDGTTAAAAAAGADTLGNTIAVGDLVLTAGANTIDLTALGVSGASTTTTDVLVSGKSGTDVSSAVNGGTYDGVAVTAGGTTAIATTDLSNSNDAKIALTAITAAIAQVASDRGTIGANINTLTSVENVMTTQSTNTLSAENDVTATNYGQATSDMSKYQILSQTGIAALAQANQSQQLITKLLQ